jgi:hypothetical protein
MASAMAKGEPKEEAAGLGIKNRRLLSQEIWQNYKPF